MRALQRQDLKDLYLWIRSLFMDMDLWHASICSGIVKTRLYEMESDFLSSKHDRGSL